MKRRHSYSTTDVERIDVCALVQHAMMGCIVAIDVAKTNFVAGLATPSGEVQKLIKFSHPRQTSAFLDLLRALRDAKRAPVVVMEPTGT
jgi:hypothetical protein